MTEDFNLEELFSPFGLLHDAITQEDINSHDKCDIVGVSHRDYSLVPKDLPAGVVPFLEDALVDGVVRDPTKEELECTWWRLNNLYWIRNKDGKMVRFRMNREQYDYWKKKGNRNCILKCRQLGFSTLIQIEMLDNALFTPNFVGAVISYDLDSAQKIFTKIKSAYDRLPSAIRDVVSEKRSTTTEIHLVNGSSISVGTTARGGTLSQLHVSEYGKICAKYPEKAAEIRSGSFPAVPVGGRIDIESTAEGDSGDFYKMSMDGLSEQRQGIEPDSFGFKFFFYPWWQVKEYSFPDKSGMILDAEMIRYFNDLEHLQGITLDGGQKAWYQLKYREQRDLMRREYPSYPEEAFSQAIEGAIYASEFAKCDSDGRISLLSVDSRFPVHTAWDIGFGDDTAIVFFQVGANGIVNVVDCYSNNNNPVSHYAQVMDRKGYWYGKTFLPHDAHKGEVGSGKTIKQQIEECGIRNISVLPRTNDVMTDIQLIRGVFNRIYFCSQNCKPLLTALRAYKRQWDSKRGVWRDKPLHDWASNYADAFRYMVIALPKAEKSGIGSIGSNVLSFAADFMPKKAKMGYEQRRKL